MSIFNQLFNPFFSNRRFEENKSEHIHFAKHFLSIYEQAHMGDLELPHRLDFFFQTNDRKKANLLKEELENMGYTLEKVSRSSEIFWITGQTMPLSIKENDFKNWVQLMNEVGFVYDCVFDGWGMLGKR